MIPLLYLAFIGCSQASLIDKDTTKTTISSYATSKHLSLVMSDEFNVPGRSFQKGKDPNFEAIEKPDDSNQAMEFCKS